MNIQELMDRLESLGFYQHEPLENAEEAKKLAIDCRWPFAGELKRGPHFADAEELAEGFVGELLSNVDEFLSLSGVKIEHAEDDFGETSYTVLVNDESFTLYTKEELEAGAKLWELATQRTIAMLNHLLEGAGAAERCYLLYGGNDAEVIFLTAEMFKAIAQCEELAERDRPAASGVTGDGHR